MSSPVARSATPEGPGSVSGAPHLPEGFTGTFTSRYVDTAGLRQHVVTGASASGTSDPVPIASGYIKMHQPPRSTNEQCRWDAGCRACAGTASAAVAALRAPRRGGCAGAWLRR